LRYKVNSLHGPHKSITKMQNIKFCFFNGMTIDFNEDKVVVQNVAESEFAIFQSASI